MINDQSSSPIHRAVVESLVEAAGGQRPITHEDLERIAAEEAVHPISVLRAYVGIPIRGTAARRASRAASALAKLRGERQ